MNRASRDLSSLQKDLATQWLATGYSAGVSVFLTFFLGRVLGPASFGHYSFALTVAALFLILQNGGYNVLLFREKTLPSYGMGAHQERLFSWALGHTIAVTTFGTACVLILPFQYRLGILAAIFYYGLQAVADTVSAILTSDGRFPQEALWQAVVKTLGALGILCVLFFVGTEIWMIFGGWAAGLLLCLIRPPVPLKRPLFGGFTVREVRRACLGFMAIEAASTVYYRCDIILLSYLGKNSAEVGYYVAAYRFLDGIVLMAAPLRLIWFRKLRLTCMDLGFFKQQIMKMCGLMVLAAVALFVMGLFLRESIVALTFGSQYVASAGLLPWLLFALIFILPKGVLAQGAVAQNLERPYAWLAGFSSLLNIGLNLWLIPGHGAMGAAWATIVTEGFMVVALTVGIGWKMGNKQLFSKH